MDDKPKFIAKATRVNTKAIAVNKGASNSLSVPGVPDIPTFDLDQLNLVELSRQLKKNLNQPEPFFMFTSRRRNEKLRLGKERLEIIMETIEQVRSVNQSLAHARAEILLSKAVTESLINNHFNEAILMAELRKAEHDNSVSKHYHEITAREIQLEAGNIANLRARAEVNLLEAEVEFKRAMTETERARAQEIVVRNELRVKVVDQITPRLASMPQNLLIFIIQSVFNPQAQQSAFETEVWDLLKDSKIKEAAEKVEQMKAITKQQNAAAEKQWHESRIVGSQANIAEMDEADNKRKYDSNR